MPPKLTFQSARFRGPVSFDVPIRVRGVDWPPESYVDASDLADLDARKLERSANLSDLASASAARANLGLGSAATLDAPASGNASAAQLVRGDDSRLSNARAPLAHQHSAADITSGQLPDTRIASAAAWNAKGAPNAAAQAVLAASFQITAANGTYQDTGLSIALPSAGTYIITANVRGDLKTTAGSLAYLVARLFNVTDGAAVAESETVLLLVEVTNQNFQQTAALSVVLTVAAAKTIRLEAMRNGSAPTWGVSTIASNANGRTRLGYLKVL